MNQSYINTKFKNGIISQQHFKLQNLKETKHDSKKKIIYLLKSY
jgi:hypothetical protein